MAAILKICFALLLLNRKVSCLETWQEVLGQHVNQKWQKSFRSKDYDGRHGGHLKNLFCASSPEPKGQLTRNLVGTI